MSRVLNKTLKTFKGHLAVTIVVAVVILLAIAVGLYYKSKASSQIPSSVVTAASSVNFTLYYPSKLPSGYSFKAGSVGQPQSGVVIFSFQKPGNQAIYVSQEAKPSNFKFSSFTASFKSKKTISTPLGQATIGLSSNNAIASLVSPKSWTIINSKSSSKADYQKLEVIINSLLPVK